MNTIERPELIKIYVSIYNKDNQVKQVTRNFSNKKDLYKNIKIKQDIFSKNQRPHHLKAVKIL